MDEKISKYLWIAVVVLLLIIVPAVGIWGQWLLGVKLLAQGSLFAVAVFLIDDLLEL
jgi:hypothetical protein